MSVRVSTLVWGRSQAKGHVLLLMLSLADQANDDGYCWPKQATLARRLRLGGDRAVRKAIAAAEEMGELSIIHRTHEGRYIGNAYQINLEVLRTYPDIWDVPPEPQFRPAQGTTGTTVPVPPEPQFRRPPEPQFRTTTVITNHQDNHQKDGAVGRAGEEKPLALSAGKNEKTGKATGQVGATSSRNVPGAVAALTVPAELLARPGWEETWGAWLEYRRERQLTCTPATLNAQLRKLAAEPDPLAVIDQSITNGWAGLFALKSVAARPKTQAEANERFMRGMEETSAAVKGVFDE